MLSDIGFCRINGLVMLSLHPKADTFIQIQSPRNDVCVGVYNIIIKIYAFQRE